MDLQYTQWAMDAVTFRIVSMHKKRSIQSENHHFFAASVTRDGSHIGERTVQTHHPRHLTCNRF